MSHVVSGEPQIDAALSRRGFLATVAAAGAAGALPSAAGAQSSAPGPAVASGLKVLSAGSTLYGMRPAAETFTRGAAISVAVATDHGHNIEKFALAGTADADVVVIPTAMMAKLVAADRADKPTLVEIGAVRIGAAVHDKMTRPDVTRMDALRTAVLAAREVLLTNAPTGEHLAQVFARMGIENEIKPKTKRFDTATLLNKYVAEHPQAGALGFGPTTEILTWRSKGVTMAGNLPDEIQVVLPYQAGMLSRTPSADNARKLLAFLATPPARKHFHYSGVQ
jgi:molybdate transport system substrate-binding protein